MENSELLDEIRASIVNSFFRSVEYANDKSLNQGVRGLHVGYAFVYNSLLDDFFPDYYTPYLLDSLDEDTYDVYLDLRSKATL